MMLKIVAAAGLNSSEQKVLCPAVVKIVTLVINAAMTCA